MSAGLREAAHAAKSIVLGIGDLIYPRRCLACGGEMEEGRGWLCGECASKVVPIGDNTCPRCGKPLGPYQAKPAKGCHICRNRPLFFSRAIGAVRYGGPVREMILKLKFGRVAAAAYPLAELLTGTALRERLSEQVDLVVPVPLSRQREWRRGYNQAELLARRLARGLRLKLIPRGLVRVRAARPQAALSPRERRKNLTRAFAARRAQVFRGKRVLVVDDVMTTAATCAECARALKEAGAKKVIAAVVAR